MTVAVLFAREDSIYKSMPGCDVFDVTRDARMYSGHDPVIAHPPCRAWGRLRTFAKPRHDEKDLAHFAIAAVRRCGGVLEHPGSSTLWRAGDLPGPFEGMDAWGGWTLAVDQGWFGHAARKRTWLYIVGLHRVHVPLIPLSLGDAPGRVETMTKPDRERTPPAFANFLFELAAAVRQ